VRVLEQQQHIVDAVVLTLLDEGTLKRQPIRIGHHAEPVNVEPSHE
jgi:hypothetical protein